MNIVRPIRHVTGISNPGKTPKIQLSNLARCGLNTHGTQCRFLGRKALVSLPLFFVLFGCEQSTDTHNIYDVPPAPIQYRSETAPQVAAWERALGICDPVSVDEPAKECTDALGLYFMDRPVWESLRTRFYYGLYGIGPVVPSFRPRSFPYSFGYDDYAIEEIPLWRDIFDGRFEERKSTFTRTMREPGCVQLSNLETGGVHESMYSKCEAREMYKYADTIHACFASHELLLDLRRPSTLASYEGMTQFEEGFRRVEENIGEPDLRETAKRRMTRAYLRASWLSSICKNRTFVALSETLRPLGAETGLISWWESSGFDSVADSVRRAYHTALQMAVRAGDEWAIRSYAIKPLDGETIKYDLLRRYPLVTHRNLAAYYRDSEEGPRHQAKAYLLLKELAGAEVADREFDREALEVEIDYVLDGGELKLYPTREEFMEQINRFVRETAERSRAFDREVLNLQKN